jgi:methionine aminopeptidase
MCGSRYHHIVTWMGYAHEGSVLFCGVTVKGTSILINMLTGRQTALMYKNSKKKIDKGVAFPTCVSVNNTVCHFSPLASDETVLAANDVVKM